MGCLKAPVLQRVCDGLSQSSRFDRSVFTCVCYLMVVKSCTNVEMKLFHAKGVGLG